jgi:GABA(A) receptor-associated protein
MDQISKILNKYPDRIPVIINKRETDTTNTLPSLDNNKYLLPRTFKYYEFILLIRKKIKLESNKAIFVFVDNILPPNNTTLEELYSNYKDPDGYLYVTYCLENTFGGN